MRLIKLSLIAVSAVALLASTALAQSDTPSRNAVSFVGGVGSTTSTTGVVLGGSWLFDLNDWTSLEAQGTYLDRGAGADAASLHGSLLVNMVSARKRIVPYGVVGGGMHRTSFDLAKAAYFGSVGTQFAPGTVVCPAPGTGLVFGPGAGLGPGTGTCPADVSGYWGMGQMPAFYARRLGPMVVPMGGIWQTRSFVDPAMSFGGGLRFNVTERLMVRPDVRALVVFADGDTHTIGVFGVQLGYRF
jgi:hypothetical protein